MFELSQQQPPAGIILDDLSARTADLLKVRVAGLVELLASRGGLLIVTSNHSPSATLLNDLGGTQGSAIDAPYFTEDEVRELVVRDPAPAEELLDAWTKLIHASTSGGHPLLCVAKTVHLRARAWPREALLEDLVGVPSKAVKETRHEARLRLLADLPSASARDLLARVSTVFTSFEDELVLKLCLADPAIPNSVDALTLLKGSWIESSPDGGWRLSPLITDLQGEVPPNEAQRWRQLAAEYWLSKRTLDARTLPLCFWNAYLGKHIWVLLKLGEVVLTLPPEALRGAASLLSPMTALRTDVSLLPEEPTTAAALRVLQIRVGDATENEELVAKASMAWLKELESVPTKVRDLFASIGAMQILDVDQVKISPVLQLALLLRLYISTERAAVSDEPEVSDLAAQLTRALPEGIDVTGMMFAKVLTRIRDSATLEEMVDALNGIDHSIRSKLVESAERLLAGGGIWIHNAWAQEQLADDDLADTYSRYDRMHETVIKWNDSRLDLEFSVARSVLLDEGLKERVRAISVIDDAIARQGPKAALVRQKSKVLRHSGDNAGAARLLLQVEPQLEELWPFDQMLALREGAISCANAGRIEDSLRLFRKAEMVLQELGTHNALVVGLRIEQALAMWRNNDLHGALSRLADAFEALEEADAEESRQGQRAHRYACGMAGLFFHEILDPFYPSPEIGIGDASNLESNDAPDEIELRSLDHNWQILELLEVALDASLGIGDRNRQRNGSIRLAFIASLTANCRFSASLAKNDVTAAVASIQPAVTMLATVQRLREHATKLQHISLDDISPIAIEELCAQGWKVALQGAIGDIILFNVLTGSLNDEHMTSIAVAVESQWGNSSIVDPLIAASKGEPIDEAADWPVNASAQIPLLVDERGLMPAARLVRDLYLVHQTANSMARRILEPLVLQRVSSGWTHVMEHQRFALRMPNRSISTIEESLRALMVGGIRRARKFFDAAAPAVGVTLPHNWRTFLDQLANVRSVTNLPHQSSDRRLVVALLNRPGKGVLGKD
jgi:hypothetical protein